MCKVLIIEPHGDDALCSCSSILRNKDFQVDIITLAESRSSTDLPRFYPAVTSTEYLMCKDINYNLRPKVSTHDIHNRFLEGKDVYEYYLHKTFDTLVEMKVPHDKDYTSHALDHIDFDKYTFIFIPVGLVHPFHIITREWVEHHLGSVYDNNLIYYGDKPYLGNRYAKECLESFMESLRLGKLELQYADREVEVGKVLKGVYPTETTMLRFSSQALLHDPDVFLANDTVMTKLREVLDK